MAVQDQGRGAKAVGVVDDEGDRSVQDRGRVAGCRRGEVAGVLLDVAGVDGVAAAQGVAQQLPRPDALVSGPPDGIAFQVGDRLDALGLALAVAPLCHALKGFQGVEAEDLEVAARGDEDVRDRAAQGGSHVTGRLEPAMSGTFRARAWSTICWASARLYDRCLSMKTGTARPEA